jgi:hypothetical protein
LGGEDGLTQASSCGGWLAALAPTGFVNEKLLHYHDDCSGATSRFAELSEGLW